MLKRSVGKGSEDGNQLHYYIGVKIRSPQDISLSKNRSTAGPRATVYSSHNNYLEVPFFSFD
jgi:hypothetical protein